jgi:crotonobetainyl-CoA:carnitine CoA-transferase CaiB-like acyl-CoA transferase
MRPLEGIRVLDFTHALAGPFCTRHLELCGAEVIKVEPPLVGDDFRARSNFFVMNSSKRSVTVNLKDPKGREVVARLAKHCDVAVENFRPSVAQTLGVSWEQLHEIAPQLIYCSITGFGSSGPLRDRPAIEWVIQAVAGVTATYTSEGEDPRRSGIGFADAFTGYVAFSAILAALFQRSRTGEGHRIDVSMLEAVLSLQSPLMLSDVAKSPGNETSANALRSTMARYRAKDRPIFIAMLFQRWFEAVARAIGRPELISDPRYSDNDARMKAGLTFVRDIELGLQSRTALEWEEELGSLGVPAAALRTRQEVIDHPQITESGFLGATEDVDGTMRPVFGLPFILDERDTERHEHVPALGEDTETVLAEIGYSKAEIEDLRSQGVV